MWEALLLMRLKSTKKEDFLCNMSFEIIHIPPPSTTTFIGRRRRLNWRHGKNDDATHITRSLVWWLLKKVKLCLGSTYIKYRWSTNHHTILINFVRNFVNDMIMCTTILYLNAFKRWYAIVAWYFALTCASPHCIVKAILHIISFYCIKMFVEVWV